ncbi:ABC transporter ATP-binding protein [Desulfosporosinus burensis]
MLLDIKKVSKVFGGLKAVNDASLQVKEKSITGLIGPNGAGKSTLFNCIARYYPATQGEIYFKGEKISHLQANQIATKGLARTFQTSQGFAQMTVMENMLVIPKGQKGEQPWQGLINGKKVREQEAEHSKKALQLLEEFGLIERRNDLIANLSAGESRIAEIARQLMLDPEVLLLDEPAAGINPALQNQLVQILLRLRTQGLTLLIVDHNLGFISSLCDYIYVLNLGQIIAEGTPQDIFKNPKVIEVYLGGTA